MNRTIQELLNITSSEFAVYMVDNQDLNDGGQIVLRFDNGMGASIVQHDGSYELEMAVIEFGGDATRNDWEITYDTPITSDVLGHLSIREMNNYLFAIKSLVVTTITTKEYK